PFSNPAVKLSRLLVPEDMGTLLLCDWDCCMLVLEMETFEFIKGHHLSVIDIGN
ncbi:MAG: hypothetical protein K0S18_1123, partial [Anaerocolumna sp.]|nr:hypothetical protein [Anaerocolumna sp.]